MLRIENAGAIFWIFQQFQNTLKVQYVDQFTRFMGADKGQA